MYLTMNISILGSMPWQEVEKSSFIASDFMARIWGPRAAVVVTILMLWTAFASVFSLLLGYSRVPYAAALDGDYFPVFARVHPKHHFPHVSLLVLGSAAIVFCLFRLADVVTALVVIRIVTQFLAQTLGIIVLRTRRPDFPRPFRMWLYPLPALLAFAGYIYTVIMRPKSIESIRLALLVVIVGTVAVLDPSKANKSQVPERVCRRIAAASSIFCCAASSHARSRWSSSRETPSARIVSAGAGPPGVRRTSTKFRALMMRASSSSVYLEDIAVASARQESGGHGVCLAEGNVVIPNQAIRQLGHRRPTFLRSRS